MKHHQNQTTSIWKSLKYYFKLYKGSFLFITFLVVLGSLITVFNPKIINWLLTSNDFSWTNISIYCSILFLLIIILGLTIYLRRTFSNILARKIEVNYRNRVLNHLLHLDMNFYEKHQSGEIITKVINDTNTMADNAKEIPILFIGSFITFIGSIFVMAFIEWRLTLVVMTVTVLILIFAIISFKILRKWYSKTRKVYTKVNAKVLDRLNVIKLIKANATEDYERKYFKKLHQEYIEIGRKTDQREGITLGFFITAISSINIITIIAGIIFINLEWISKNEIASTFLPFVLSVNTLIFPIFQTVNALGRLASATVSVKRLNSLLESKSEILITHKAQKISHIKGDIAFENVSFNYNNEINILNNFSFTFKKNLSYAIVGATGVGKTTISKLLLRFYDPQSGKILINGKDLKKLDLKSYLSKVGYIEQEPEIFNGNFLENISYGTFNATFKQIADAAVKANLHDFIMELPNKYQTIVGEKGFILSGGQKQRVLIARMILKNPELLILDEATSSLDNIVEKEIQHQLNSLMINRTSIIIAHRLSTIKNVDQIIVLEKNAGISQIGTFSELINTPGHFKKLYEAGAYS